MSLLLLFQSAQLPPASTQTGGVPIGLHYDRLMGLMWEPRREDFPALTDDEWKYLLLMFAALYN